MSAPELSVVCKSCGSEVSPYVTECPYCGTRLRKRAPKLERGEDGLTAKEPRRQKVRRARRKISRPSIPGIDLGIRRSYAVWLLVLAPALLLLYTRIADDPLTDFGLIFQPVGEGPLGQPVWHYFAAPFVYNDIGYLFVACVGIALFGSAIEERLGTLTTLILALGCGALGMLGGEAIESVVSGDAEFFLAAGGNGIALGLLAAWTAIASTEARASGDDFDPVPIAVAATVLFALPLVEDTANVYVALSGAIVGGLAGLLASTGADRRR